MKLIYCPISMSSSPSPTEFFTTLYPFKPSKVEPDLIPTNLNSFNLPYAEDFFAGSKPILTPLNRLWRGRLNSLERNHSVDCSDIIWQKQSFNTDSLLKGIKKLLSENTENMIGRSTCKKDECKVEELDCDPNNKPTCKCKDDSEIPPTCDTKRGLWVCMYMKCPLEHD